MHISQMVSRLVTAISFSLFMHTQTTSTLVQVPLEIMGMIARRAKSSDICSPSLVQRSWRWIAQSELFRNIRIVTILQSHHLIHAFMCNTGHENPRKGHSRVLLENFVQNIYLDITGNPINSRLGSAVILRGFDSSFTT
jgi:hypothetical protein